MSTGWVSASCRRQSSTTPTAPADGRVIKPVTKAKHLLALFIIAMATTTAAQAHMYTNPEFSAIAAGIVGEPITVHCVPNSKDYFGYTLQTTTAQGVSTYYPDIYLEHEICIALNRMLHHHYHVRGRNPNAWSFDQYYLLGAALLTITHEAYHIKLNSGNEAIVECMALHHIRGVLNKYFQIPVWLNRIVISNAIAAHKNAPAPYQKVC